MSWYSLNPEVRVKSSMMVRFRFELIGQGKV